MAALGWVSPSVPTCLLLLLACACALEPAHAKTVSVNTFDALSKAVQDETNDEIVVSGALSVTSKLHVSGNLSITAASHGAASLVRWREYQGVMLLVDKGHLLISNMSIGGENVQGSDSAVEVRGNARFVDCIFNDNRVDARQGGAITNWGELTLTTCVFNNNHAFGADGELHGAQGTGEGGAVYSTGNMTLRACVFNNNHAVEGGAIQHVKGRLTLKSCRFANNSAASAGGAVSSYWKGSITNCAFENNSAEGMSNDTSLRGGAIAAHEGADLSIQSCNFTGGAAYAGAAISLHPNSDAGNCSVRVEGCKFINGSATNGGAASVEQPPGLYSVLTVVNCYFDQNAGIWGGTLYVEGTLNMNNSILVNSSSAIGALAVKFLGSAKVYDSRFISNMAQSGGAIGCLLGASVLQVEDTLFEGNFATSEDGGAILLPAPCSLVATRCRFTRNFSARDSGAIHVGSTTHNTDAPPTLTSCNFVENVAQLSGGAINSGYRLAILNSTFDSNQAADGGAIRNTGQEYYELGTTITGIHYIANNLLSVTQCTFRNNFCTQVGRACTGGAIHNYFGNTTILGSTFINNSASLGGAFYSGSMALQSTGCHLWPTNTTLKDSTFFSNSAGKGGAVAVDSPHCESIAAHVRFHNVTLTSNAATNGAAFYITCFNATTCPTIDRCTLTDNIASDGGAAMFCNIVPNIFCSDGRRLNSSGGAGCLDWVGNIAANGYGNVFASIPVALKASNTSFPSRTSQQPLGNVSVYLVDQFHQAVYSSQYDGTVVNAMVLSGSCNLLGNVSTAIYGGSALLNITVNGTEGDHVLQLSTDGAQLPPLDVPLVVGIRGCQQGEVSSADGGCEPCSAPTFSWDPSVNCSSCPENAICFGGAVVVPDDGFWRSSFYSADILQCPNAKACTNRSSRLNALGASGGSWVSAVEYRNELCAEGYTGNLCAICSEGYGMTRFIGKTHCSKCPSTAVKAVYMLIWIMVEVALVSALIAVTVMPMMSASTGQLLNGPSQLKLTIHFLQLVALAFSIQHEWPAPIDYTTEALATVFLAQSQLLPLDCFMSAGSSKALDTALVYAVLPIAAIVPPVLFWSIQHWWLHCQRRKVTGDANASTPSYGITFSHFIVPSILCVEFFLWPTTVANFLALFSCRRVDAGARSPIDPLYNRDQVLGYYWQSDMSVKCFEGEHLVYALAFGIPGLLLSVLLLPGCVCWALRSNRNQLNQPLMMRGWGFHYMMYKPRAYLWDVALHSLKLALVINSVLLVNAGGQAQNAIAFGIVTVATFLHWHTQPYVRPSTERLSGFVYTAASYLVFLGMLDFLHPSRGIAIAIDVFFAVGLGMSLAFTFSAIARSAITDMRPLSPGSSSQANLDSDAWTSGLVASSPCKAGNIAGAVK